MQKADPRHGPWDPREAVEDVKPGAGAEAAGEGSVTGQGLLLRVGSSSAAGSPPVLAYSYSLAIALPQLTLHPDGDFQKTRTVSCTRLGSPRAVHGTG